VVIGQLLGDEVANFGAGFGDLCEAEEGRFGLKCHDH
jgi:hypothetical protein